MSKEEFEKKITENRQFNEHLFVKKSLDKDLFFNNLLVRSCSGVSLYNSN